MKLSVIIPALNEAANIRRAVESAWQAGADEVLVADGGSEDDTPRIAAELDCRVIQAPRGRAVQQNAAADCASGDVLLFLHADCALTDAVRSQIARVLSKPFVLHGALQQRIDAPGIVYRLLERGNAARVRWLGLPYGDQGIFVRRNIFEKLGGFPDVPLLEDLTLMKRLRVRAWPVLIGGPLQVSPRHWKSQGVVRQTLLNWWIVGRHSCGTSPERLAACYRARDSAPP